MKQYWKNIKPKNGKKFKAKFYCLCFVDFLGGGGGGRCNLSLTDGPYEANL